VGKRDSGGFRYWHEAALLVIFVALIVLAWILDPSFLRLETQVDLSRLIWELALLSLPMTLIIITAGIDLSVGASMSLAAVVLGLAFEAGMPPWLCAILALAAGAAAGLLNGVFVAYVRVHPLIVTLATMSAYYGIAEGVSHARPISGFPVGFTSVAAGSISGLPVPGLVFALAAIVAAVFLAQTPSGQALYAIGLNETATRFTGIAVDRIKLWLYTSSGFAAAMAAVLFVARRNTAKADIGQGMELDVITAVVLGGTSIYGGRGRIVGTLLGVLLIHETRQFVSWHWERDELNLIVVGSLLVVAVLINALLSHKRAAQ
jgi:rhamnose transport system permease protein